MTTHNTARAHLDHDNPWGLSPRQIELMDAICTHGCQKLAARDMGIEVKTVEMMMTAITSKMGFDNRVQRILAWDRWRRGGAA
jgi:DNA-binding NarL/FixJ family response regulator